MDILKVVLTSVLSIVALFIVTKIMGHKQIAELDFFDYITGITIGSIAAELATELEKPWKPLIPMIIYSIFSVTLSVISNKFPKSRKYINGTPTIVMNNGKLYRENMKKAKLNLSEFMVMCRQQGYFNLNDIQTAVYEYNGKLTVLPLSNKRPANPEDLKLAPKKEYIMTEVIMDGHILTENLKRMGTDEKWLIKEINSKGYKTPKEIYLGLCDENKKLSLFTVN